MTNEEIEATRMALTSETSSLNDEEQTNEEVKDTTETQSNEVQSNEVQETPAEPQQSQSVETPAPAPEYVSKKDYDEMLYSLKRQMGKQKDRYENKLTEWDKKFGAFQEQFNKWANPEKELNPEDFATYGEYAKAVVEKEVERRWADKEKSMREEYENYQKQYEQDMKHRSELDKGISKWYPDEASRTAWHDKVSKAYEDGLEDLLNQEKNIVEYLHQTPNYPLILEHFATHKDQVEQICMLGSPLMRILAVHDLENKLVSERSAKNVAPAPSPTNVTPAPVETPKPVNNLARPVGKPGNGTEAEPDIFGGDHSALRDALRAM